jgi:FkbM family methyltransferase
MEIRGKTMYIPLSHPLAFNVSMNPHYDGVIERISDFIRKRDRKLIYIDVGANIGDTILFCNPTEEDQILGIDADELYLDYFRKNLDHLPNVQFIRAICASTDDQLVGTVKRDQGTAKIVEDEERISLTIKLDTIIQEYQKFNELNFLKVDTDGYDFEVIKGARDIIARKMPAVLFECEVNENENFTEQFISTMQFFREIGYKSTLLYDNFGYLFGRFYLDNISNFRYPLFYQLNRKEYYYDILVMPESQLQKFLKSEIVFYQSKITDKSLRQAVVDAAVL